ncbi:MAG: GNAT family N-acetyltransferase [Ardenticatenaceae bacterium]|nr:GNAT family N-acetyltransferase [Ardenticatenaceae bacterium]
MNSLTWLVRAPQNDDAPALAAIATAVSQPRSHVTPQAIGQSNGRFWIITQDAHPIGYATLLPLPGLPHLFELAGGIVPQFQRQGAGSFLWQTMQHDLAATAAAAGSGQAVQQITYSVPSLDSAAACFLQHHQFALEHEELTLVLPNLAQAALPTLVTPAPLQRIGRQTAVSSLPELYQRCFIGTPWFQPYSPAEVAAIWEPDDELYYLGEHDDDIGFVWLHFPEPTVAEIEPVGIVPEKQGVGYGRSLLTTILHQLQNRDIQTVSLGVWANNQTAIHLYKALGFQHSSSSFSLTYTLNPK